MSNRRLAAAHLAGAGAIAILAQFAVDMPGGYFGPVDRMTVFGALYTVAAISLVALGAHGCLTGRPRAANIALALFALNIGAFVVPLATDPILAGGVVGW
ncbi:MAG: hypothetical protein ABIG68_12690, partial [Acidobacteriota bacterium]